MTLLRPVAGALSALALCLGFSASSAVAAPAGAASAEEPCRAVGQDWYCHTRGGTVMWDSWEGTQNLAGIMREGEHWFHCWIEGNQHEGGNLWYFAGPLDERPPGSNGGIYGHGFIRSIDAVAGTHPIPQLGRCAF